MAKRIFISYCHKQGDWVWDDLKPVLAAGGAEVLLDRERFEAGKAVVGQMDATQDTADMSVLVLSPDYLASDDCRHEMQRAIACDPNFQHGLTIPIVRENCHLPAAIKNPNPLYVDLQNDKIPEQWNLLLQACAADLGCTAPDWLAARDAIVRFLQRGDSVNLVVPRLPGRSKPRWRALIDHLEKDKLPELAVLNMESGSTATRQNLVQEMLKNTGLTQPVPAEPNDLVFLAETLQRRTKPLHLALLRFDIVADRVQRTPHYNLDLFAALRDLMTEKRKLVLLIHSHSPYAELLPQGHPLSSINSPKTVELRGQP